MLYVDMCLYAHAVIRGSHGRLVYSIELPIKTFSGAGSDKNRALPDTSITLY